MPDVELSLAYPGLHLRDDVYATHGHYLDLHLTIPRLESIAASAMARVTGRGKASRSASDYEAIMGPLYAFYASLAQGASPASLSRGGSVSREVWRRASAQRPAHASRRFLLGRVTIPGAVAALNGLGLGPFRATLTGEELRRAGLLAMARVAEVLAPGAEHVIFGHTHRPGPLPGDEQAEWTTLSGTRLWNTGSWLYEGAFVTGGEDSPYWPGTVLTLEDDRAAAARERARLERACGRLSRRGGSASRSPRAERVRGHVELARALAERPRVGGPQRRVVAVAVDVVARAAAA